MNKLTKTIVALLCLLNLNTYAQTDAPVYEFYGSVVKNLPKNYKPVSVMIKVDVDKAGKVEGITLSDSAQPDFRTQFEASKNKFDTDALNKYVKLNKLKSTSFMIPYYVTNKNVKTFEKEPLLTLFDGKDFKGKAKILRPINLSYSITKTITTPNTTTIKTL